LATSDRTIVIEKQPDGKMRVTSGSCDGEKVFLKDQVLETWNVVHPPFEWPHDDPSGTSPRGDCPAPQAPQTWPLRAPIVVTKDQLDQLEVRGYLDPDLCGNRVDEVDAIEAFLSDSLVKESV
jgi:hypothetical protein